MTERVEIKKLETGVPGLDEVLGGGLPELSFNLLGGGPGCGKTSLAHQLMFAMASDERPALYITILGEPPIKMLRYQQQYAFFDARKLSGSIRFLHLGAELLEGGLERVLEAIVAEVEATSPRLVFVDSFRAVVRAAEEPGQMPLHGFIQRLSLHLTSWEATTFLIGEYEEREVEANPIFTVADGILWLSQFTDRNSIVRKLQVIKMRGQGQVPGLHTIKISGDGIRIYPRLPNPERLRLAPVDRDVRRTTGLPALRRDARRGDPLGLLGDDRGPVRIGQDDPVDPVHPRGDRPGRARRDRRVREAPRRVPDHQPRCRRAGSARRSRQAQDALPPPARPVGRRDDGGDRGRGTGGGRDAGS